VLGGLAFLCACGGAEDERATARFRQEAVVMLGGEPLRAVTVGRIELARDRVHAVTTFPEAGPGQSARAATILVGDTTYLEFPPGDLPPGKRWLRAAAGDGVAAYGFSSELERDPRDVVARLRVRGARAARVGRATVDGVETTRYRVRLPGREVEVWEGADGLARRIVTITRDGGVTTRAVTTYFGFGDDVEVEPPPEALVVDAADADVGGGHPPVEVETGGE
jgi:hypothetical protein